MLYHNALNHSLDTISYHHQLPSLHHIKVFNWQPWFFFPHPVRSPLHKNHLEPFQKHDSEPNEKEYNELLSKTSMFVHKSVHSNSMIFHEIQQSDALSERALYAHLTVSERVPCPDFNGVEWSFGGVIYVREEKRTSAGLSVWKWAREAIPREQCTRATVRRMVSRAECFWDLWSIREAEIFQKSWPPGDLDHTKNRKDLCFPTHFWSRIKIRSDL